MQKMVLCSDKLSDRRLVKARLKQLGIKVVHDSGSRFMVIDVPKGEKDLKSRLPSGVELVAPEKVSPTLARDDDEQEMIFVQALKLRQSKKYRDLKAGQTPGESPEELEIYSAPCMEED